MDGFMATGAGRRRTLRSRIGFAGIGLHSGRRIRGCLAPAGSGTGITFLRTDLGIAIPARHNFVVDTRLCTVLGVQNARIGTVEHVMAALAAHGVDDAVVEVDGAEIPIFDGSAEPFQFLLDCAGIVTQPGIARSIEVLRPVRVREGDGPDAAWAELHPADGPYFEAELAIDFAASAIGRQLNILGDAPAVTGAQLAEMDDAQLREVVKHTNVFARVAPEHKMRIVEALQARGHVVAMTGDGVNDAPALKTADIGVAMGITGTVVTKEAATLVLIDDNFASIVGAVKEGRTIYDNIVQFVRFQLSTNIGAILTVLGASLFGFPTPFTPIQILWVNIIMDGPPAMTLGVEPARDGIMQIPPRARGAAILTGRRLLKLGLYGLIMAVGTLGAYVWGKQHGDHGYAVTLAFTTFVFFQFFNIFNARAERGSAFNRQFLSNGELWLALTAVVLLQVVVVHWGPAQAIFDTVDLSLNDWAWSVAIASSVLFLEEARKLGLRILRGRGLDAGA